MNETPYRILVVDDNDLNRDLLVRQLERKGYKVLIAIAVMAFITIFYNPGWLLLLILIILFGFRHPAPLDDQTPIDGKRKLIDGLTFLAFILSFTPAPFPQFVEEFKQVFHWF